MLGGFSGFFVVLVPALILMAIGALNILHVAHKNDK